VMFSAPAVGIVDIVAERADSVGTHGNSLVSGTGGGGRQLGRTLEAKVSRERSPKRGGLDATTVTTTTTAAAAAAGTAGAGTVVGVAGTTCTSAEESPPPPPRPRCSCRKRLVVRLNARAVWPSRRLTTISRRPPPRRRAAIVILDSHDHNHNDSRE